MMILLLGPLTSMAQKVVQLDLKQCITMALDNDQRVKISELEQQRLKYQRNQSIGMGVPQISASGSFQDFLKLPTQLIPGEFFGQPGTLIPVQFGTNYNMSGGIQVSQLIYNQSFLVSLQIGKRMLEANQLDMEKNKQAVVSDVSQLYYLALLTKMQVNYMDENLGKLDSLAIITKVHFDKGFIKKTDYDRLNVNRTNLQSEINNLAIMFSQQLSMLKYFAGLNPEDSLTLTESIFTERPFTAPGLDLENHISLRMLDKQKDMLSLQMSLTRAQCLPSLGAFGDFSYNNQQNDFDKLFNDKEGWLGTSVIGLSLNVPIFSGMQKYYQLKQTKVQLRELSLTRDESKKLIGIDVQNATRKLQGYKASAESQKANVDLAGEVYKVVSDQYRQGITPLTDLLSAESSLIAAQSGYAQAIVQVRLAEIELYKASGNLLNIIK
jgi:outer membrane protein TolC